jgi:hypothetical protein
VGEALGLADGDADGLVVGDAEAVGVAEGETPGDGLPLADVPEPADGDGVGDGLGARATMGRAELFGRAAKNRGGRLKVGTSSQNGECGSSAKYRLTESAALSPGSIRNGPICQSAGMVRTTNKMAINPAKNSTNPNRRRQSDSSPDLGVPLIGAAATRTPAVTAGVAAPPISLASRSCSFALSANEAGSCGWVARHGRERICGPA